MARTGEPLVIEQWLASLGLAEHAAAFRANDVDGDMLGKLTDADLRELGVTSLGQRKRLLEAARAVAVAAADDAAVDSSARTPLLGHALREYRAATDPVLRLWHACDLVELLLRFAVIVGWNDACRGGAPPRAVLGLVRGQIDVPTLGRWYAMAKAVTRQTSSALVPELAALVHDQLGPLLEPPGDRTPANSLLALRNQLAHGGGVTRRAAARLADAWADRLDALVEALRWMADLTLVVRDGGVLRVLRGSSADRATYEPPDATMAAKIDACMRRGDEVVLVHGDEALLLWPLAAYSLPVGPGGEAGQEPSPQIYVRRGELGLELTPIASDDVCVAYANDEAYEAFLDLFRLRELEVKARDASAGTRGFEPELAREGASVVGRDREIESLTTLAARARGVVWVEGTAGVGKSALMARVASLLVQGAGPATLVVPYRFRAGDDRCARVPFLALAAARLGAWLGEDAPAFPPSQSPLDRLGDLLRAAAKSTVDVPGGRAARHVVFVLDGLDEVHTTDRRFVTDVVLSPAGCAARWICAGRAERGLGALLRESKAEVPFPGGLAPLSETAIRGMILDRIGPLRKRLLQSERDDGDHIVSPFVQRIVQRAEGLPLYVRYVIGDILGNRYRALDGGEALPPSLASYHAELLRRCAVGPLQQALTPLVALLAVAYEPLSAPVLADLLARAHVVAAGERGLDIVRRVLSAVGSMVRATAAPSGDDGYSLFHTSLRQHMTNDPDVSDTLVLARTSLGRSLLDSPDTGARPADTYLERWGVTHLTEVGRQDAAIALVVDLDRSVRRLEVLGARDGTRSLLADCARLDVSDPRLGAWAALLGAWERFLVREEDPWPASRALAQIAADYGGLAGLVASRSCSDAAATDSVTLRLCAEDRPDAPRATACTRALGGHADTVVACAFGSSGVLAISGAGSEWQYDCTARVWDLPARTCRIVLEGHDGPVLAVGLDEPSNVAVTGSADGALRLFSLADGSLIACHRAGTGAVRALVVDEPARTVLAAGDDGAVRAWPTDGGGLAWSTSPLPTAVNAIAIDIATGQLAVGGDDGILRFYELRSAVGAPSSPTEPSHVLELPGGPIRAVSVVNGTVAVGCADGAVRVGRVADGELRATQPARRDAVLAVAVVPGRPWVISSSADEALIRVFDHATCTEISRFPDHGDTVFGLAVTPDGAHALSCSRDYTVRTWTMDPARLPALDDADLDSVTAFASDGFRAATGHSDGSVRVVRLDDLETVTLADRHAAGVMAVAFDGPRGLVASAGEDRAVSLWDLAEGRELERWLVQDDVADGVAFSPCASFVAFSEGCMELGAASRSALSVRSLANDGAAWRTPVGPRLWMPRNVVVTPDGGLVVAADDERRIALFDARTGRLLRRFPEAAADVRGVAVSPDGRHVVTGDEGGRIRVLAVRDGRVERELLGHGVDYVRGIAWSHDGRLLITSGDDSGVRLWRWDTAELLAVAAFPHWPIGVSHVARGERWAVGLGRRPLRRVRMSGVGPTGPRITTAGRRWVQGVAGGDGPRRSGAWEPELRSTCTACGTRATTPRRVVDALDALAPAGTPPLAWLDLADIAWDEPALASECPNCRAPLRHNPFRFGPHGGPPLR